MLRTYKMLQIFRNLTNAYIFFPLNSILEQAGEFSTKVLTSSYEYKLLNLTRHKKLYSSTDPCCAVHLHLAEYYSDTSVAP